MMCLLKKLLLVHPGKKNIPINDVLKSLSVSLDQECPLKPSDVCSVPNWVKVGGWEYRPGGIIVLKKSYETESSLPKFAVIRYVIAKTESQIFIVLSVLKTISFHTKHHSYLVEERTHEKNIVLNILECGSVEPLDFVKNFSVDSNKYVNPRHII